MNDLDSGGRKSPGAAASKRRFSDFFFTYSWNDLAQVHYLRDTMVAIYACSGVIGLILNPIGDRGASLLIFAVNAVYPGYLIGCVVQRRESQEINEATRLMIWQIGNVAKLFALTGAISLVRLFF